MIMISIPLISMSLGQRDLWGAVWTQQWAGADHYCHPDHGLPHRLLRCNWKRAGHRHLRSIPPSASTLHDRRVPVLPGSVRHAASADSSVTDGRDIDWQLGVWRGAVQAKPRYVRHQHQGGLLLLALHQRRSLLVVVRTRAMRKTSSGTLLYSMLSAVGIVLNFCHPEPARPCSSAPWRTTWVQRSSCAIWKFGAMKWANGSCGPRWQRSQDSASLVWRWWCVTARSGRVLIRAGGKCWRRQRTLRLMALLVVLFLLFQLPYTVVLLIKTSTPNPPCEERTKLHLQGKHNTQSGPVWGAAWTLCSTHSLASDSETTLSGCWRTPGVCARVVPYNTRAWKRKLRHTIVLRLQPYFHPSHPLTCPARRHPLQTPLKHSFFQHLYLVKWLRL